MFSKTVIIQNVQGFHLRPAQLFSELASTFESEIGFLAKDGDDTVDINPKSILGLMAIGLEKGAEVIITANGPDAEKAVTELATLIESGFGE
jgi:phosphocarrier protein HPr